MPDTCFTVFLWLKNIAKKYDIETEVIYKDNPCPIVDYNGTGFKLVEEVASEVYPGVGICPYVMTGGTDAKYYGEISDHCIRFAPLYIDAQQYGSVHALNENIHQGALPMGVDFYKKVIMKSWEFCGQTEFEENLCVKPLWNNEVNKKWIVNY